MAICVLIEVQNARAGSYLPTSEAGKWRESRMTTEARWREWQSRRNEDPTILTRPLTPKEKDSMETMIRQSRALNSLRELISSIGLMQYLVAPLATVLCAVVAGTPDVSRSQRRLAMMCTGASLTATVLMLYRGYISSLG